ncbi:hypothetical protein [Laspinema olomoucense]|uniref:hypothetical protein n=1 Tax=Laspinema olomoucense TaxID=3231600 RepID=UPI0021BB7370|nr:MULTISPECIES: hypothetical protein [unclassified Laspinema]MCT7973708.1 hypothetical protein [Laspinema sp. D3d]MCT7996593.1 hypothetical protein [Laspinema sp. D3c]
MAPSSEVIRQPPRPTSEMKQATLLVSEKDGLDVRGNQSTVTQTDRLTDPQQNRPQPQQSVPIPQEKNASFIRGDCK